MLLGMAEKKGKKDIMEVYSKRQKMPKEELKIKRREVHKSGGKRG
jgi:hypothetical protein